MFFLRRNIDQDHLTHQRLTGTERREGMSWEQVQSPELGSGAVCCSIRLKEVYRRFQGFVRKPPDLVPRCDDTNPLLCPPAFCPLPCSLVCCVAHASCSSWSQVHVVRRWCGSPRIRVRLTCKGVFRFSLAEKKLLGLQWPL
jgi:hypothetical protein